MRTVYLISLREGTKESTPIIAFTEFIDAINGIRGANKDLKEIKRKQKGILEFHDGKIKKIYHIVPLICHDGAIEL